MLPGSQLPVPSLELTLGYFHCNPQTASSWSQSRPTEPAASFSKLLVTRKEPLQRATEQSICPHSQPDVSTISPHEEQLCSQNTQGLCVFFSPPFSPISFLFIKLHFPLFSLPRSLLQPCTCSFANNIQWGLLTSKETLQAGRCRAAEPGCSPCRLLAFSRPLFFLLTF